MNEQIGTGILYVDDESISLKYFREAFEDLGEIFTSDNPLDGLDLFKSNHHNIRVVLSDHRMKPENGVDFLKKVRACNPAPVRILVTAMADPGTVRQAIEDGLINHHYSKPWDPEELKQTLVTALHAPSTAHNRA